MIQTDMPVIDGVVALSFLELMELRVVKAILQRGLSLQHVRRAASLASVRFNTRHPFASRSIFTDGRSIFSDVPSAPEQDDIVRWDRTIDQVIAGGIARPFVHEIDFNEETRLAERWWPRGREVPIVLDPTVRFGAPVVAGTATLTSVVAKVAEGNSVQVASKAYGIGRRDVRAAMEFEETLAAA